MSESKIAFEIVRQEQFTASDLGDGNYLIIYSNLNYV